MVLSKIEMPLSEPAVRIVMRDAQKMHQLATALYQLPRQDANLLYRVRAEGHTVSLYLYADLPVDRARLLPWMQLAGERDLGDWLATMQAGQLRGFDLLTMPFKKVSDGMGRNSRRRVLRTQEERLAWLSRKAEQNGFTILTVQEEAGEKSCATHSESKGSRLYLDTYRYSGILRIDDVDCFREAVRHGIGPGKAYGLGMLLLK